MSSPIFRGSRIVIVHGGLPVVMQDMDVDLTQWHSYRIQWRPGCSGAFSNHMVTPVAEVTDPGSVPSASLVLTTWVDNYSMTGDPGGYTIGYLDVPAMDQYIDVDYTEIYLADPPSSLPVLSSFGVLWLALGLAGIGVRRLSLY